MQRQNATARWAKSRQTPWRSLKVSQAVRVGARVLVAEGDVVVDEVADRLDAPPAGGAGAEQLPGGLGQPVRLAVAAAQQVDQGLVRQILHRVLHRRRVDRIGGARIVDHRIGAKAGLAGRGHHPAAPVAEAVAVGGDRQGRVGHEMVGAPQVGDARVVHVQGHDHRRRLRAVVDDVVADADLHDRLILIRRDRRSCASGENPAQRPRFRPARREVVCKWRARRRIAAVGGSRL